MAEIFYTILTNTGKAKIANATLLNTKVNFSKIVVGDGNGNYYNPTENQSTLVHQVWEGSVGNIKIDEQNSNWVIVESIIPSDVGGFMIREVGLLDNEGDLLVIAKYPETYKPTANDGTVKDLIVRLILEVANTQTVTLKIDPSVVLATKKDLIDLGNAKANSIHEHLKSDITDFEHNHNDLYHTKEDANLLYATLSHRHNINEIDNFDDTISNILDKAVSDKLGKTEKAVNS
ncbi:MAG: phage tail protein, partial [Peptoanaerobacter stomatis]|uniref:phage tail protein n=1 Tax=Peptoanaerobacter stomatis TaxID=796937 RepID=UPI003FA14630